MPHLSPEENHEFATLSFGIFLVLVGLWTFIYVGYRLDRKLRADAQVPVQLARLAEAMEREYPPRLNDLPAYLGPDLSISNAIYMPMHKYSYPRRHATKKELDKIDATPGCFDNAYVGADQAIHPDYCR